MLWLKIPVLVAAIADAVQLPVPNSWFGQHKICWKCHQVSSLKKKTKKPQKNPSAFDQTKMDGNISQVP